MKNNLTEQYWEQPRLPSLFFQGMAGSRLLIAVANGEGRADFSEGRAEFQAATLPAKSWARRWW